jgi:hypothetical protein
MEFSRLEMRDILANVNRIGIDPDVLAKLEYGANSLSAPNPARLVSSQHAPIYTPEQIEVLVGLGSPHKRPAGFITGAEAVDPTTFHPMTLTEAMVAKGWNQDMVDGANEQTRLQWETEQRVKRLYKPIVGENNASNPNAAFAPPDVPNAPPPEKPSIGSKNRWGDECAAYQGEDPVYRCKEGHGYLYGKGSVTAGCPQCFLSGNAEPSSQGRGEDPDAVPGEDSGW